MTLVAMIRRMAARTIGVAVNEVDYPNRQSVWTACFKLAAKGELHRAQLGSRSVRFFTNGEFRDAFMRTVEQLAAEQLAAEKAALAAQDDGFRPEWTNIEAIVPAHVKVQRLAGFTPRFQEADRILPGIVSFGLQRGRVTIDEVELAIRGRQIRKTHRHGAAFKFGSWL